LRNEVIKDPHGLYRIWFTTDPADFWPVSNSSLWLEWRLYGMSPTGYHVTSVAIHIVVSLLIWAVLRQLSISGAFLAALLFTVHPVNVESVAWVSQRKTILATAFLLVSIFCYLKADPPGSPALDRFYPAGPRRWYWLSFVAFLLAMLSKASVATLPLVLLLVIWWHRGRITRWDLVRMVPFFVAAVLLVLVNIWFQQQSRDDVIRTASFAERLAGAGLVPWFYLSNALWPANLVFIYPMWQIDIDNPWWWLPLAAAIGVTGVLWWRRESWWGRPLLFAWGFYWLGLAPVLGFNDVTYMKWSLVADHYQYIAIAAVVALAGASFAALVQKHESGRPALLAAAAVLVIVLMTLTWQLAETYRDPITLYRATIAKNPACSVAYYNLGNLLFAQGGPPEEALAALHEALRLSPDDVELNNVLGAAMFNMGRPREAVPYFEKSLQIKPDHARAHDNLANALAALGDKIHAMEHYQRALELDPKLPAAHRDLGVELAKTGRPLDAILHLKKALDFEPDHVETRNNLGAALIDAGQAEEAVEQLQQVVRLRPDNADAWANLTAANVQLKRLDKALETAVKARGLAQAQGKTSLAERLEVLIANLQATTPSHPSAPVIVRPAP
jgi:tetratricopeptide (TPR) repeat protein